MYFINMTNFLVREVNGAKIALSKQKHIGTPAHFFALFRLVLRLAATRCFHSWVSERFRNAEWDGRPSCFFEQNDNPTLSAICMQNDGFCIQIPHSESEDATKS